MVLGQDSDSVTNGRRRSDIDSFADIAQDQRNKQDHQPNFSRVLEVLADPKCMEIFQLLLAKNGKGHKEGQMHPVSSKDIMMQSQLSRKQFYARSQILKNAGLIGRKNESYEATIFGQAVLRSLALSLKVIQNYWQITAIGALPYMPSDKQLEIIKILIKDKELQELVLSLV